MAKRTRHGFAKADDPLFTEGFSITPVERSSESRGSTPSNTSEDEPNESQGATTRNEDIRAKPPHHLEKTSEKLGFSESGQEVFAPDDEWDLVCRDKIDALWFEEEYQIIEDVNHMLEDLIELLDEDFLWRKILDEFPDMESLKNVLLLPTSLTYEYDADGLSSLGFQVLEAFDEPPHQQRLATNEDGPHRAKRWIYLDAGRRQEMLDQFNAFWNYLHECEDASYEAIDRATAEAEVEKFDLLDVDSLRKLLTREIMVKPYRKRIEQDGFALLTVDLHDQIVSSSPSKEAQDYFAEEEIASPDWQTFPGSVLKILDALFDVPLIVSFFWDNPVSGGWPLGDCQTCADKRATRSASKAIAGVERRTNLSETWSF